MTPTITLTTTISPTGWLVVASLALALFVLVLLLIVWSSRQRPGGRRRMTQLPSAVQFSPQPLMTETEAAFYNVLRLAVQDEYLVFAQVPLWCLVELTTRSADARRQTLEDMALKRVDFVLVHPGNLNPVKVIELEGKGEPTAVRRVRNAFVDAVLSAAGVEVLRLPADGSYTIPSVAALLEIEQPD